MTQVLNSTSVKLGQRGTCDSSPSSLRSLFTMLTDIAASSEKYIFCAHGDQIWSVYCIFLTKEKTTLFFPTFKYISLLLLKKSKGNRNWSKTNWEPALKSHYNTICFVLIEIEVSMNLSFLIFIFAFCLFALIPFSFLSNFIYVCVLIYMYKYLFRSISVNESFFHCTYFFHHLYHLKMK